MQEKKHDVWILFCITLKLVSVDHKVSNYEVFSVLGTRIIKCSCCMHVLYFLPHITVLTGISLWPHDLVSVIGIWRGKLTISATDNQAVKYIV